LDFYIHLKTEDLEIRVGGIPHPGQYHEDVERLVSGDRSCALAAAAMAQDFNNELTVILSTAERAIAFLDPGHPARVDLADLQRAARRCARKCNRALTFSAAQGIAPAPWPLEAVVDM
jgi:hypothetical protein